MKQCLTPGGIRRIDTACVLCTLYRHTASSDGIGGADAKRINEATSLEYQIQATAHHMPPCWSVIGHEHFVPHRDHTWCTVSSARVVSWKRI